MSELIPLDKVPRQRRRATGGPSWLLDCQHDDRGRVIPNLANALIALRGAPELSDAFAFDEMLQAPILLKELPVAPKGESASIGPAPRPIRDTDVSQLQEWLQHLGMPRIGKDATHQAVDQRAQERAFHPVKDYLDGLTWDGRPRLDRWLSYYLGTNPTDYTAAIGAMFLIAMVARIYKPGEKADYMLVLEGEQGAGKSRACRTLGGEWFSDSLPDIRDKDAMQHHRGKWLIEIAELAAIGRAEAEALKAFISRQVEHFRPAYGRKEVAEPRQCLFVGTTNKSIYLKDETGARRFWPVKVGAIDIEALAADRDQLFAEAVEAFRAHKAWWPDADLEREHIKPEQQARYETDPWEQAIGEFVALRGRVTVTEVARDALGLDIKTVGTAEQRRISSVLAERGWKAGRDFKGRFYSTPGPPT
jgi:predicted P-loop ATPase